MERGNHRKYARRSAAQWASLVAEHGRSGLSQRAFCERHDLSYSSFGSWKRRLEAAPVADAAEAGFIELAVGSSAAQRWDVELDLGSGVVLRVRRR